MEQEKRYIDLHTHTNYSDGVGVNPKLNVRMALLNGIDVLAITDHDHYIGYFKAKEEAEKFGIILLPGTEITTPKYHLLALNFDPFNKRFLDFLSYSRDLQREKSELRVQRLQEHGIPITIEKVVQRFPESRLGKYNVFVAMVEDFECRKFVENECFDLRGLYKRFQYYMNRNGISGELPDIGVSEIDAITAVHEAGGLIGPAHFPKDAKALSELDSLVALGIDFLEVQPNQVDKSYKSINYEDIKKYAIIKNIPLSYGSDWHGPTFLRPFLEPNENVLSEDLEELLNSGYVKISRKRLEEVCY